MTTDPYFSARLKLEWAKKHIGDLEQEILLFKGKEPYIVFPDDETETGDLVYRFQQLFPIPETISLLVGDGVHNLRSALDHVAYVVAEKYGLAGNEVYFPIASGRKGFEAKARSVCPAGSSEDALLQALMPYNGGNDYFWFLHRLDIHDKHKLLISAVFQPFTKKVVESIPQVLGSKIVHITMGWTQIAGSHSLPLKSGTEIERIPRNKLKAGVDMHPHFTFQICFVEPVEVKGMEILYTLSTFEQIVRSTIEDFASLV